MTQSDILLNCMDVCMNSGSDIPELYSNAKITTFEECENASWLVRSW